jgi:hypothetical protein
MRGVPCSNLGLKKGNIEDYYAVKVFHCQTSSQGQTALWDCDASLDNIDVNEKLSPKITPKVALKISVAI